MHYDTALRDHGLPHDPFKALVVPRPIGWVATIGKDGVANLAPYSFFNAVSDRPPMRDVLLRRAQGQPAQHRGHRRVHLLDRHLGAARGDEPELGPGGPAASTSSSSRACARPTRAASARRAWPNRPQPSSAGCGRRCRMPPHKPGGATRPTRSYSGRWSASTSTMPSSRTAWCKAATCGRWPGWATWTMRCSRPSRCSR